MAPEKKRVNKRKSRTAEVSSASSSSESESESSVSSSPAPQEPEVKKQKQSKPKSKKTTPKDDSNTTENEVSIPERKIIKDSSSASSSDKAFEEFYLRQAAQEFANDLDKLRSAGDFSARSVGMLIAGLKQGSACFGVEERARVVAGVEG